MRNWPFRDCRPCGCFELLDFAVGYDEEVVVGPEETSVTRRGDCYFDCHEQAAIVAVPDSNGIRSGRRDPIALWRILGCFYLILVVECLHFASGNVPDVGCPVTRRRDETRRGGREIDAKDGAADPVRGHFSVCLCVPHKHVAPLCPRCDPSAILGYSETYNNLRFHCCHLFTVFHSPHSNPLPPFSIRVGHEILAVR